MKHSRVQPCWSCRKCYGDCSWSKKHPEPVEGWVATPTEKQHFTHGKRYIEHSFAIYYCPIYEWDGTEVGYGR